MLGSAWLLLTFLLLVAAILFKQPSLLIVAIILFLASGISRLWSSYSLQKLDYNRHLSAKRVFFGENITLEFRIVNRKFLPLPWLHVEEEIPEELTLLKGRTFPSSKPTRSVLSSFLSIGWYHRLTRRYPIQCLNRGMFFFGPTVITSGDPFGFFKNSLTLELEDRLLVYPRILELEELGIPSRHPFGDLRIKRHLFEDPVQVMTTRDYVPGDPLKHIHWKSSARLQRLQTRLFEHTTTIDLALFLDTRTTADIYYWSLLNPDFLETMVLTATAIAANAIKQDYKVGFYANEYYWYSDRPMRLPPSNHPDQLKEILESLAQVRGIPFTPIETLLTKEARNLAWESTIVVISTVLSPELRAVLRQFQRVGRRMALVLIGSHAMEVNLGGITVYHVSEQIYQKKLNSLKLSVMNQAE
jgi:uncharacterized protein (DUF58 family)